MERLTELYVSNVPNEVLKELGIEDIPKQDYELVGTNHDTCKETCEKYNCLNCPIKKAIDKLAEYEDLEEQGLLLKLPCKVGDTVYTNFAMQGWYMRKKDRPYKAKIVFVGINGEDNFMNVDLGKGAMLSFKFSEIGKIVFLTEQEAQAALEKMKGE